MLGTEGRVDAAGPWKVFALFDADGRCVAGLEAAVLPLVLDGSVATAGAIRSVAVDPDWRGRGLFRRLMTAALAWCESRTTGPTLLYTEEPALYERFGFRQLVQHRFAGTAPVARSGTARALDPSLAVDRALVRALVGRRAPLSTQAALGVDADLILAHLAEDDWRVAHLATPDAVIIWGEEEPDTIVVADVIAEVVPDLATILGALPARAPRVEVLFPPDRIGWHGTPEPEDAGLMIRGTTPAAMRRPFMFPPTAEF